MAVAGGGEPDDPTIENDDLLYRRIHSSHRVEDSDGKARPTSAAFEDKEDGVSVFLHSELVRLQLRTPDVVGFGYGRHSVAILRVVDVRGLGCGVTRDPDPPEVDPHPCDPAHALVHLPKLGKNPDRRLRKEIASKAELVDPPPNGWWG